MAVSTSEQLIDAVRESGLLTAAQFDAAAAATEGMTDVKRVAVRLIKKGFLSRWQANQIIAGTHPSYLGKYKLIDRLTEGDAGAVYLAEHERMERRVILKTLTPQGDDDTDQVQRFLADARKLATLDHRNIIHVYDVDKQNEVFCLVMEYVRGEDLQQIVERDGALPFYAASGYVALAADALGHAHHQGIEHRNVKPDRLLLDRKGELKVLDIGIAGLVDPDQVANRTAEERDLADVDYVAPEQATGKNKIDYRADIYSLGCTFFYLLTGRTPFEGETADLRLKARLRKTPPSVLEHRPDAPPELAEICAGMMATQPRDRCASAAEVAQSLDQWLRDNGPPATAVPPRPATDRQDATDGNGAAAADDSSDFAFAAADGLSGRVAGRGGKRKRSKKGDDAKASPSAGTPAKAVASGEAAADQGAVAKPLSLTSPIVLISAGGALLSLLLVIILAFVFWPDGGGDRSGTDPDVAADGTGGDPNAPNGGGPRAANLADIVVTGADGQPATASADGWFPLTAVGKPGRYAYRLVAKSTLPQTTGFRIEWEGDKAAAKSGLALNEIEVFAGAQSSLSAANRLPVAAAKCDPPLPSTPGTLVIDNNYATACNIPLQAGQRQTLFCSLAAPVTSASAGSGEGPYFVQLVLHTSSTSVPPAGRFRVAAEPAPIDGAVPPTIAPPADTKTLAHWRFEHGSVGGLVKNLTQFGTPVAAEDSSQNGNSLFCRAPAVAPKFSDDVPAAEMRRGQSSEKNSRSLNGTIAPPPGETARYLQTDAIRAQPAVDLTSYVLPQWTVEASFKVAKREGQQTILAKNGRPPTSMDSPLQLRVDGASGRIEIAAIDRNGKLCTAATRQDFALTADQWVHVAAVSNGIQLKLHVDALDGKGFQEHASVEATGGLVPSIGDWTLGAGMGAAGAATHDALAMIDEVRVSAAALDPQDFLFASQGDEVAVVDPQDPKDPGDGTPSAPQESTPPVFHVLTLEKEGPKPDGVSYKRQQGGFYLVQGASHDQATYRLKANVNLKDITGLRLEVAPHDASGAKVGRSDGGGFVVTNVLMQHAKKPDAKKTSVKWKSAAAGHADPKHKVAGAIDGDGRSGWSVGSKVGEPHWAVFDVDKPFGDGSPRVLWIDLHHAAGKKQTTAHFRLSAVTGTGRGEQLAAAMRKAQRSAKPFVEFSANALPALPTKDFPAPDFADPRSLGVVNVGTVDDLLAELIGGDAGHGASGRFDMQAGAAAGGEKLWDFRFAPASASAPATIARLRLVGQDLALYWLDAAKQIPEAGRLRNCLLQLKIGEAVRQIPLRVVQDVQPVAFGLGKASRGGSLVFVPDAPEPGELRIELRPADAAFGPFTLEPAEAMAIDKGEGELLVGEKKSIKIKLATVWESPSIRLRAVAHFRPPGSDKDVTLSPKAAQRAMQQVTQTLIPAKKKLAGLEKKKVYDGRKSFKSNEKREYAYLQQQFGSLKGKELDEAIKRGQAFVAKVAEVSDKMDEVVRVGERFLSAAEESGAFIQVRVFRLVDDKEVDLVRSTGWEVK